MISEMISDSGMVTYQVFGNLNVTVVDTTFYLEKEL